MARKKRISTTMTAIRDKTIIIIGVRIKCNATWLVPRTVRICSILLITKKVIKEVILRCLQKSGS